MFTMVGLWPTTRSEAPWEWKDPAMFGPALLQSFCPHFAGAGWGLIRWGTGWVDWLLKWLHRFVSTYGPHGTYWSMALLQAATNMFVCFFFFFFWVRYFEVANQILCTWLAFLRGVHPTSRCLYSHQSFRIPMKPNETLQSEFTMILQKKSRLVNYLRPQGFMFLLPACEVRVSRFHEARSKPGHWTLSFGLEKWLLVQEEGLTNFRYLFGGWDPCLVVHFERLGFCSSGYFRRLFHPRPFLQTVSENMSEHMISDRTGLRVNVKYI